MTHFEKGKQAGKQAQACSEKANANPYLPAGINRSPAFAWTWSEEARQWHAGFQVGKKNSEQAKSASSLDATG